LGRDGALIGWMLEKLSTVALGSIGSGNCACCSSLVDLYLTEMLRVNVLLLHVLLLLYMDLLDARKDGCDFELELRLAMLAFSVLASGREASFALNGFHIHAFC